jgi:uncharacterized membrane protein YcaP (DUF421 family)
MIFDGWSDVARVLIVGTAAYAGLVVALLASGKRTLTKLNAFDLVVTVALGSTLATVLLNRSVALVEGLAALALLIGLQFVLTWLAVRVALVRRLVKAEPTFLVENGMFDTAALRQERITRDEVLAAMRGAGLADARDAAAVVLETDGSLSILRRTDRPPEVPTTANVRAAGRGRS